jgi:hypothetical protein
MPSSPSSISGWKPTAKKRHNQSPKTFYESAPITAQATGTRPSLADTTPGRPPAPFADQYSVSGGRAWLIHCCTVGRCHW